MVLDDDMEFLEGTYRLPDKDWQVFIVSAFNRDVDHVEIDFQRWQSGVTGVFLRIPRTEKINAVTVERALSEVFCVTEWVRVRGPDSMQLR